MQDDHCRGTPDRFGKDFWQLTWNFLQAEKLQTLIKAAGVEVEPIWTSIFAKVRTNPDDASDIETFPGFDSTQSDCLYTPQNNSILT